MSERNYYVLCENNCKFPAMTKEQTLAAIEQAVNNGTIENVDAGFITRIKEQNNNNALLFWVGTYAEYNAIAEKVNNCFYIITDDDDFEQTMTEINQNFDGINAAIATLNNVLPIEDNTFKGCYCRNVDGGIEWINPPMEQGVEYRTTERWRGNPVYTKLVYCGYLANSGTKSTEHGCFFEGATQKYYGEVIRYCGTVIKGYEATGSTIPRSFSIPAVYGDNRVEIDAGDWAINIKTNYDCSAYTAYVQIWYTKTAI